MKKLHSVQKMVFIGAGNMAEALVNGMMKGGIFSRERILVTDVRPERLTHFRDSYGVAGTDKNAEAARDADMLILAVKPQMMESAVGGLRASLRRDALSVSIAAGITTSRLEEMLGEGSRVVRVMPNTPALVGAGAAALCRGRWANEDDLQNTEILLGAVGMSVRVEEKDMDAVTAVSGSGPAYVFFLMEAMLGAAGKLGLDDGVSRKLVCATVEGAARLMRETGLTPAELRERVTSKGGTTAAALDVLKTRGAQDAFVEAILAAHRRARELSGS